MFLRKKYTDKIEKFLKITNSVFLLWSRQVGKTSILKSLIEFKILEKNKTFYINFDDFILSWNSSFENIFNFIDFLNLTYDIDFEKIDYFLFDEVKNLRNFNILLKSLIDKFPEKKFICTSSWNYIWTNEIVEWLAGRTLHLNVYPLDFEEFLMFKNKKIPKNIDENIYNILEKFLKEYLVFWWYPQVVLSSWIEEKKLILKSIIESVFIKDIKWFLKQEKILDLHKLFTFLWTNIWSTFSYEWISGFIWEKVYYTKQFLNILKQNFLIFELLPFVWNKRDELKTKSKIYLSDFWIKNYFLNSLNIKDISWEEIEMFVFLNKKFNLWEFDKLNFWQNRNKSEIDFILEKEWKIIPIEVKISNKDVFPKIFFSFEKEYKEKINYFVRTTKFFSWKRRMEEKDVHFESFLN